MTFLEKFNELRTTAYASDEGQRFTSAGFDLVTLGGGTTGWRKPLKGESYILVTDSDGCTHEGPDFLIGFYRDNDDTEGECVDCYGIDALFVELAKILEKYA